MKLGRIFDRGRDIGDTQAKSGNMIFCFKAEPSRCITKEKRRKKKKKEEKEENRRITTVASNITTFLVHKHLAKIRIQISKGAYLPPASGLCIFWIIFVLGTGSSLENYIAFAC